MGARFSIKEHSTETPIIRSEWICQSTIFSTQYDRHRRRNFQSILECCVRLRKMPVPWKSVCRARFIKWIYNLKTTFSPWCCVWRARECVRMAKCCTRLYSVVMYIWTRKSKNVCEFKWIGTLRFLFYPPNLPVVWHFALLHMIYSDSLMRFDRMKNGKFSQTKYFSSDTFVFFFFFFSLFCTIMFTTPLFGFSPLPLCTTWF